MRPKSRPREMVGYKNKVCIRCGGEYQPTGPSQKCCAGCIPKRNRERTEEWDSNNPERRRAISWAYYLAHPERAEERKNTSKKWYLVHPERETGKTKAWRLAHPERTEVLLREWNLCHPGYTDAWHLAHPEQRKAAGRKHSAKHRLLGLIALNSWFVGCEGHHINNRDVIYIPRKLHRSIYHNQYSGRGMAEMNALAGQYLTEDWT